MRRIELRTSHMRSEHSTSELHPQNSTFQRGMEVKLKKFIQFELWNYKHFDDIIMLNGISLYNNKSAKISTHEC